MQGPMTLPVDQDQPRSAGFKKAGAPFVTTFAIRDIMYTLFPSPAVITGWHLNLNTELANVVVVCVMQHTNLLQIALAYRTAGALQT